VFYHEIISYMEGIALLISFPVGDWERETEKNQHK